jgi:hypothetical protein
MREQPRLLFVARTGEYLGVLRSALVDGSGTFIRRDGSIGQIFEDGVLYALDDRLTLERVVMRRRGTVRRLPARSTAIEGSRAERSA